MAKKRRLDALLVERNLAEDLHQAVVLIGAGRVSVGGMSDVKAGSLCDPGCRLELKATRPYVSRAGEKLLAGLEHFNIDPTGFICADIGCSTGGFTDCLLQHGASRVYSVDVGYGILDWKLRQDNRVVVHERTNARYLTVDHIPEVLDIAVIDASFISLKLLLGPLLQFFDQKLRIVALVKPQFELPRDKVAKGGVVHENKLHQEALQMVQLFCKELGLNSRGIVASPVRGTKGNQEFLLYLTGTDENGSKA